MRKQVAILLIALFLFSVATTIHPTQAQIVYTYSLTGPYHQSTESISATDSIKVEMKNVNGTGGYYAIYMNTGSSSQTIVSSTPITYFSWNASSVLNYTALIWPNPNTFGVQAYRFFVVDPGVPTYIYTFPVADFAGMTNAYISDYNLFGVPEEQFSLMNVNSPSFIMAQFQSYTITITCDQGVYTQAFTAGTTLSTNLQVLSGSFPVSSTNSSEATATRTTPTNLQIKYADPDAATTLLTITIYHMVNGVATNDLVDTTTGTNSYTYNKAVDNATDYNIRVQATRYGTVMEWDLTSPAATGVNIFAGQFDFLGTWPAGVDPSQVVAAAIIMLFLGLGSFRSAGVSCLLAWGITGIMIAIGWYNMGIPMFVFAGFLTVLVVIAEGKETARDV